MADNQDSGWIKMGLWLFCLFLVLFLLHNTLILNRFQCFFLRLWHAACPCIIDGENYHGHYKVDATSFDLLPSKVRFHWPTVCQGDPAQTSGDPNCIFDKFSARAWRPEMLHSEMFILILSSIALELQTMRKPFGNVRLFHVCVANGIRWHYVENL